MKKIIFTLSGIGLVVFVIALSSSIKYVSERNEALLSRSTKTFKSPALQRISIKNTSDINAVLNNKLLKLDSNTSHFLNRIRSIYGLSGQAFYSNLSSQVGIKPWPKNTEIVLDMQNGVTRSIFVSTETCTSVLNPGEISVKIKTAYDVEQLLNDGGVCTILSTAHSIVKKFGVPTTEFSSDNGRTFKKDFLNKLPNSISSDIDPMSNSGLKAMHEAFNYNNQTFSCDTLTIPRNPNVDQLKTLCLDIKARMDKKQDCSVAMSAPFEGPGHAVNYISVNWNDETKTCDTEVVNTSEPSLKGDMSDVSVNPTTHKWNIGLDPESVGGLDFIAKDTQGKNDAWNSYNYSHGSFYCCQKVKSGK